MKLDVLGMGLVAIDHTFINSILDKKPKYIGSAGGGSVGNTLAFLGSLGFKTGIIGAIGNDKQSEIIKQDLKNFGTSTKLLVQKGKSGDLRRSRQYFQIISENKHTHSYVNRCPECGIEIDRNVIFTKNDLTEEMVNTAKNCKIIHIDRANDASISLALSTLHSRGLVSFDFSFDSFERARSKVKELMAIAHIVKVTATTFNSFTKKNKIQSLKEFSEKFENIRLLVITNGELGVYGYIKGSKREYKEFEYPAVENKSVYDTSGAGDTIVGAILAQIISGSVKLELGFEKQIIQTAQGLASAKCCFYGARSYSRILSMNKTSIDDILNVGIDAANNGYISCTLPPNSGIPKSFKFPFRFDAYDLCQICGSIKIKSRKDKSSSRSSFERRLSESHLPMIEAYSNASTTFSNSRLLKNIESNPILLVGSGGSYSAAVFGEEIIFSLRGNPAMAVTPYELSSINVPLKNMTPILISYGGKNSDILYAFGRLRTLKSNPGIVITGNPDSILAKQSTDSGWQVITVPKIIGSIGHLATLGYLETLCALSAILSPNDMKNNLNNFFKFRTLADISKNADLYIRNQCEKLERRPSEYHFIGMGSGWAKPALIDLESKIVEGGISTIEVSELKNFTHGRYISAYRYRKNRIAVIIRCPPYDDLANFLSEKLSKQMPVIELSTENSYIPGAIEIVIQSLYLAHYLGLKEGIDILKPRYPKEAKGMYSWIPKEYTKSEFHIE